ncbi:DIE2/ALG10 family-domain-containing protein [Morchella snyderi]|nr:DIE2/ALG10 family-domain-containing protein [Morchella snyderi]
MSVLAAATAAVALLVNSVVPEPYLDEVFHIPQAQAYCSNRFAVWDPKLTTPAGLYLLSYPLALVTACTPAALRALNALGVALVLPLVTYRILRLVHPALPRAAAAHSAVNVALFPLLFFFAGLYYTDVYSTVFVLLSYMCWLQRRPWPSAAAAWVALWFRQTNVLWAVFLLVLEGVRALELAQGEEKKEKEPEAWSRVLDTASKIRVWNPPFTPAVTAHDFFFSTPVSILLAALQHWPALLAAVLPYLAVLSSFAVFILWNNLSIVLGDKAAHQPTIHVPQLFYFATFTLLTSWPLLLSKALVAACWADLVGIYVTLPRRSSSSPFSSARARRARRLPPGFAPAAVSKPVAVASWWTLLRTGCLLAAVLAAVHCNTVLHPYLLADNRHFVFYVFRRSVLRHALARYALAPVYVVSLWAVVAGLQRAAAVSAVWVWGWAAAVAGTLVGAGLVEGRYFVVGWVLWRVHVCGEAAERWRRWVETVGFVAVDVGVLWVFLRWGFAWEGVEGVQRFMW